jgi:hypothetical protein
MSYSEDIFRGVGVEVDLTTPDAFLKIRETLTRMGVASRKEKKLFQSCHILHKQGRYSILHFKELFILDGKETNIDDEDIGRRNAIVKLLEEWNLLKVLNSNILLEQPVSPISQLKILFYKEKHEWELIPKYSIGRK